MVLGGWDEEAEGTTRKCPEWGDQFVAEHVGVPSLCSEHWESVAEGPSDLDHAFHEFVCLRTPEADEASLPVWACVEELVSRMWATARLSRNCDL